MRLGLPALLGCWGPGCVPADSAFESLGDGVAKAVDSADTGATACSTPCSGGACVVDLDAQVNRLSGVLLEDGAAVPWTPGQTAEVYFMSQTADYWYGGSITGPVWRFDVPSDTYDVWIHATGPTLTGEWTPVADVVVETDAYFEFAVDYHVISGTVTRNGAVPPDAGSVDGYVVFSNELGSYYSAEVDAGAYSIELPDNVFEVGFRLAGEDSVGPVQEALTVAADAVVDLAQTTWTVGGSFTAGPAERLGAYTQAGAVFLEAAGRPGTGYYQLVTGETWSAQVVPGTYDVSVYPTDWNADLEVALQDGLEITGDTVLDVDLELYTVDGTVAFGAVDVAGGRLDLTAGGGNWTTFVYLDGPSWSAALPPETYSGQVVLDGGSTQCPVGDPFLVEAATVVALEEDVYAVSGAVTVDGAVPASVHGSDGSVSFSSVDGTCWTSDESVERGRYRVGLPAGDYDVTVVATAVAGGAGLPGGPVTVTGPSRADLAVTASDAPVYVDVSGVVQYDGRRRSDPRLGLGSVLFQGGASWTLPLAGGTYSGSIPPGDYEVYVAFAAPTALGWMPASDCVRISP